MSVAEPGDGLMAAIGLMSGPSLDGIDAALLWTDGVATVRRGPALTVPSRPALRATVWKISADFC